MTTPGPQLSEKNFINEGYSKNPFPLWLWFFLLIAFLSIIWGGSNWYNGKINLLVKSSPFLEVTNRQISLFLWQNPEYMRINSKEKNAYLPGFQYMDKITLDLAQADYNAVAPPELLFRYHTWKRLLYNEFSQRPIPKKEFQDFLSYAQEWDPRYWEGTPKEYTAMVNSLPSNQTADLATLSKEALPMEVRIAFQGWYNYFIDGEKINALKPSYLQMTDFLKRHPDYARNFWRNVVQEKTPNYLKSLIQSADQKDTLIPADELTSFLRVAFYNDLMAQNPGKIEPPTEKKKAPPKESVGPKKAGI